MTSAARRLPVRFDDVVWREATRRFSREPLQIATSARVAAERHTASRSQNCSRARLLDRPGLTSPAAQSSICRPATRHPRSDRTRLSSG